MTDRVSNKLTDEKSITLPREGQDQPYESVSLIFDRLSDAILAVDEHYFFTYVNKAASHQLQKSKEELIGHYFWGVFPEARDTRIYDAFTQAMEEQKPTELEFEYYSPLKTWFNIRVYPSESGLTVIFRDFTYRQQALLAVKQSYRTLFDEHPDAVCSFDLDGYYLAVNKSYEEMFNLKESDIIGQHYQTKLDKKHFDRVEQLFKAAHEGRRFSLEFNLTKEGEKPFIVQWTILPITVQSKIIGTYCIFKNITDHQFNIQELKRINHMNKLILESVQDGILGIDKDYNVVMWNEAAERITGFKVEELNPDVFNQLISNLYADGLGDVNSVRSLNEQLLKEDGIRTTDVPLYRKDGTPYIAEYSVTPMVSDEGVVGSVFTFRDITEKKKSEEMLHQSEKLSAVGQLAAGIAHEIRNPLTSLKGFLQLIEVNGNQKKEYFDIMKSEFGRIEQILTELLILSKPQTQEREICDIDELLVHISTLLETQAIIKNIEIVKNFKATGLKVTCAQHQIKQVFVNLLKNAIEAMDNGGTIRLSLEKVNHTAIIKVIDEGCGIPQEKLNRIGEPFYSTKETGTGLGLMVTFKIIEEHGGTIQVDSQEGVGTTFIITFPITGKGE
ncbi:PAS domain-containing sensor histidine kinase [Alteribacter populi]|uniref:PAS domain-containing sensor histidine kinase n=1 Tax=Alteribacter populi TaxID=2011011 RepID=UPI0018E27449|nr:PAS domain-containing sensor histidine kinase [Alteribacter populi]